MNYSAEAMLHCNIIKFVPLDKDIPGVGKNCSYYAFPWLHYSNFLATDQVVSTKWAVTSKLYDFKVWCNLHFSPSVVINLYFQCSSIWDTRSILFLHLKLKGYWTVFQNFLFGWISFIKKNLVAYLHTKRKKILLRVTPSIFVKHAQSGDEANLSSCCCLKYLYSKLKCHNLHKVQLIFCICPKNCTNKLQILPPD